MLRCQIAEMQIQVKSPRPDLAKVIRRCLFRITKSIDQSVVQCAGHLGHMDRDGNGNVGSELTPEASPLAVLIRPNRPSFSMGGANGERRAALAMTRSPCAAST